MEKKKIEIGVTDSVIILHEDQSITLHEGESDMTSFYINLLEFILTDRDILPELEEIFVYHLNGEEDLEQMISDFNEQDENLEDTKPEKDYKFPIPGKKWSPHELN